MLNTILEVLALPIQWFKMANSFVYAHLGSWGQIAFDVLLVYSLFLIAFKISKVIFHCVFFIALPSLILSFASSFVLPFNFTSILPVCVALFVVINIFRS